MGNVDSRLVFVNRFFNLYFFLSGEISPGRLRPGRLRTKAKKTINSLKMLKTKIPVALGSSKLTEVYTTVNEFKCSRFPYPSFFTGFDPRNRCRIIKVIDFYGSVIAVAIDIQSSQLLIVGTDKICKVLLRI